MKSTQAATLTLLALLCLSPMPSFGGELSAVLSGKSFHLGASDDWNENNYGLGVEYRFTSESRWKTMLMANGFRDSNDEMSFMAGGGLYRNLFATERMNGFYVDAGINAFLMTRKDVNENRPFLGALPSLALGNRYMGINLTYLPKKAVEKLHDVKMTDSSISGIVFLQFKFTVNRMFSSN